MRLPRRFGHPGSIRRRLLLFLIPSLLLLVLSASALTYFVALHVATSAYDRSLLDPALDMAANVRMDSDGPRLALLKQATKPGDIRKIRYGLASVYSSAHKPAKSEEQLRLILQDDPHDDDEDRRRHRRVRARIDPSHQPMGGEA